MADENVHRTRSPVAKLECLLVVEVDARMVASLARAPGNPRNTADSDCAPLMGCRPDGSRTKTEDLPVIRDRIDQRRSSRCLFAFQVLEVLMIPRDEHEGWTRIEQRGRRDRPRKVAEAELLGVGPSMALGRPVQASAGPECAQISHLEDEVDGLTAFPLPTTQNGVQKAQVAVNVSHNRESHDMGESRPHAR